MRARTRTRTRDAEAEAEAEAEAGIYTNVTDAQRAGHVSVELRDNKMGYNEDVSLGLPSSSSK